MHDVEPFGLILVYSVHLSAFFPERKKNKNQSGLILFICQTKHVRVTLLYSNNTKYVQ